MKPTVVIHYDAEGVMSVFSDVPVTVLSISEACRNDRVYRMDAPAVGIEFIEALIGESKIGHRHDGSQADARAEALVNGGKPALEIVK
jgi:hypothetical protein